MFFDLQRFGGKGGTTIQSTYEPTEYELRLQALEVELTEQVLVPSAKQLGTKATDLFMNVTFPAVQEITNSIQGDWLDSKARIDEALQGLKEGNTYLANHIATLDARQEVDIEKANTRWDFATSNLTNKFEDYVYDQNDNADFANKKIKNMPDKLSKGYKNLESNFSIIGGEWDNSTVPSGSSKHFDYNLSNISAENYRDLDDLKPTLVSALNVNFEDALDGIKDLSTIGSFYNNLDSLIPEYNANNHYAIYGEKASVNSEGKVVAWVKDDTAVTNFNELLKGELPQKWKDNMKESIKTTLQNTIGEVVNDLASRGVINSSVHTQAIYDIERNAADEVAKQYLQNIQTESQLVHNRWQVKEQSLNDQKLVLNELWGYMAQAFGLKLQAKAHDAENKRAVALALAQIFTQQFSNSSNAFTQQTSLDTQKYSTLNTGINSQAQLYTALLNNQSRASADAMNWYQVAKAFADTQWAHDLSPIEQLMRMYQLRMWNAATGLNQSTTGALVALSNQGTRTQTQSSSGNFLGGILSAGINAFSGGFGAGYAGSVFPAR